RAPRASWVDPPSRSNLAELRDDLLQVPAQARIGDLSAANLEHLANVVRVPLSCGLERTELAHRPFALMRPSADHVHFTDRISTLLDVDDAERQIREGGDGRPGRREIGRR